MRALRLVGCLLALYLLGAPAALAQGAPTNPFVPFQPTATPTVSSTPSTAQQLTTTTANSGNLSSSSAIAIAVGAFLVLGGISLFIWRDARRHAHVRRRPATAGATGASRPGSKREKPRKLSPAERRRRKRGRAR